MQHLTETEAKREKSPINQCPSICRFGVCLEQMRRRQTRPFPLPPLPLPPPPARRAAALWARPQPQRCCCRCRRPRSLCPLQTCASLCRSWCRSFSKTARRLNRWYESHHSAVARCVYSLQYVCVVVSRCVCVRRIMRCFSFSIHGTCSIRTISGPWTTSSKRWFDSMLPPPLRCV
jgi:hypothetical protein